MPDVARLGDMPNSEPELPNAFNITFGKLQYKEGTEITPKPQIQYNAKKKQQQRATWERFYMVWEGERYDLGSMLKFMS